MTTPAAPPAPVPKPPKPKATGSPVIPLFLIGAGAYLMWFAVRYWRGAGPAAWPSYPVKSVLQGKGVPPNQPAPSAEAELATYETAAQGGGGGGGTIAGYANPFTRTQGLSAGRVDQGVDFGGSGPVGAIGPAVVTYSGTGDTGWGPPFGAAPGGYIKYRLTGGPAAGHEVYVAEGVQPSVTVGQKVSAGETIGQATGGGIETGWATADGTGTLSQTPQAGGIGGGGPFPTKVGQSFDRLLVALGVPAAPNLGQPGSGDLPPGYPATWGGPGDVSGKAPNIAKMLLGQFGWDPGQFTPLNQLWTRESGWSPTARNPQSGALGIAQALGHGGPDTGGTLGNEYGAEYGLSVQQAQAANSGSALQQIRWGFGYIKAVYGSPSAAEAHETALGWY